MGRWSDGRPGEYLIGRFLGWDAQKYGQGYKDESKRGTPVENIYVMRVETLPGVWEFVSFRKQVRTYDEATGEPQTVETQVWRAVHELAVDDLVCLGMEYTSRKDSEHVNRTAVYLEVVRKAAAAESVAAEA